VPADIERPPYIVSGVPAGNGPVQVLQGADLERMRHACRVAAEVLIEAGAAVAPGTTTDEIDAVAHDAYLARRAYPSTLGYRGYPKSICTSVNEVVCHGIPDDQPLALGDIVNIDVTAYVDGMHGDTSATFVVGGPEHLDAPTAGLVATTAEATLAGIGSVGPGGSHRDIGRTIEPLANARGFGVIRDYGGHGIGAVFHAAPHISHVVERTDGVIMVPGMTFTVEPMLTAGTHRHVRWDDGWTEVTEDLLPSAQFEHTVVVTDDGVEILTVNADGDSAVAWPPRSAVARPALRPT
jgi:methionyl aminopeptidase